MKPFFSSFKGEIFTSITDKICPLALGSDGPGVGGWAMVSGNPQVEGFIGIASPILLQSPVSLSDKS